jgi:hypothetical protein
MELVLHIDALPTRIHFHTSYFPLPHNASPQEKETQARTTLPSSQPQPYCTPLSTSKLEYTATPGHRDFTVGMWDHPGA